MGKDVKVVKVSAASTKGTMTRSFFTPSMDKIVQDWAKKDYTLVNTTPVSGMFGRTTHYLLTFEKDG